MWIGTDHTRLLKLYTVKPLYSGYSGYPINRRHLNGEEQTELQSKSHVRAS